MQISTLFLRENTLVASTTVNIGCFSYSSLTLDCDDLVLYCYHIAF